MSRLLITILFTVFLLAPVMAQDEITLRSGDVVKAKVTEVGTDAIVYKKYDNLSGPSYTIKKSEVFMVKYENGTKDVFEAPASQPLSNEAIDKIVEDAVNAVFNPVAGSPCSIYFYRPGRVYGSPNEIIIGTFIPDEVVVKLKNGQWYKVDYVYTGQRQFVNGIFSINEETLDLNLEPGKTYYIRGSILKGMGMQSQIELVDEATAREEMSGLKEQKKAK